MLGLLKMMRSVLQEKNGRHRKHLNLFFYGKIRVLCWISRQYQSDKSNTIAAIRHNDYTSVGPTRSLVLYFVYFVLCECHFSNILFYLNGEMSILSFACSIKTQLVPTSTLLSFTKTKRSDWDHFHTFITKDPKGSCFCTFNRVL